MSPTPPRRRYLAMLACSLMAVAGASQALTVQPGVYLELPPKPSFPKSETEPCFGEVRLVRERAFPTWDCDPRRGRQEHGLPRPGGRHGQDDLMSERHRGEEFRTACCVQP